MTGQSREIPPPYGKLYRLPIERGLFKYVTGAGAQIYAVLVAHSHGDTRDCFPSVPTIATESCCHKGTVTRWLAKMKSLGAISYKPGNGKGNRTRYVINPDWAPPGVQTLPQTKDSAGATLPQTKDSAGATKGSAGATKGSAGALHNRKKRTSEKNIRKEQQQVTANAEPAGTAAAENKTKEEEKTIHSQEVLHALKVAGVGEPTRTQLASGSHVSVRRIQELVAKNRERGLGVGVLVNDLRCDEAKATGEAKQREARSLRDNEWRRDMDAWVAAKRESSGRTRDEALERAKAKVRSLSPELLARFRAEAEKTAPDFKKRQWAACGDKLQADLELEIACLVSREDKKLKVVAR